MKKIWLSVALCAIGFMGLPEVSLAHGGGGGGGGGGHGGGGHGGGWGGEGGGWGGGGGYGHGYYGGGYGGGYYGGGGYGHGYYGGGYGGNYGHGYYGRGFYGAGFGLYGYPGDGYGYPYYGSSYYYAPSYDYAPAYDYTPAYADIAPVAPSTAYYNLPDTNETASVGSQDPNTVNLEVRVPDNAKLWVEGTQTNPTGAVRHFYSPPLKPGTTYTYHIRAQWTDVSGKLVDRTKLVDVQAGARIGVDFSRQ